MPEVHVLAEAPPFRRQSPFENRVYLLRQLVQVGSGAAISLACAEDASSTSAGNERPRSARCVPGVLADGARADADGDCGCDAGCDPLADDSAGVAIQSGNGSHGAGRLPQAGRAPGRIGISLAGAVAASDSTGSAG